jgi:hypothetical protein
VEARALLAVDAFLAAVRFPRTTCPALAAAFEEETPLPARAAAFGEPAPDFCAWAPAFAGGFFAASETRLAAHAFVAALPAVRSRRRRTWTRKTASTGAF